MIMDASWVTIKQRICMFAAGVAPPPGFDEDVLGAAEVVAAESGNPATASAFTFFSACEGEGVDAAVSSAGASMPREALVGTS